MKKFLTTTSILIIVLLITYLSGPQFPKPELNRTLPSLQLQTNEVESYVRNKESEKKNQAG